MAKVHKLSFRENPNSYPNFRSEVQCACGFHGKLARPELAISQGEAHLDTAGIPRSSARDKFELGLPLNEEEQKEVSSSLQEDKANFDAAQQPVIVTEEKKEVSGVGLSTDNTPNGVVTNGGPRKA